MADIISIESARGDGRDTTLPQLETSLIELLFFAYRDFTHDPDEILAAYGFGRAHHRVLHFVNRQPGMPVARLLRILRITKQSLGRVLKQLVDDGFIEQRPGPRDRRQRLLYATPAGRELAARLITPQIERVQRAIANLPAEQQGAARLFLEGLIDTDERSDVVGFVDR